MEVLRRGEVVEGLVMADVVLLDRPVAGLVDRRASRDSVRNRGRGEATLEPTPCDSLGVEEVTNIEARCCQGHLRRAQRVAVITFRARVAEDRATSGAVVDIAAGDRDVLETGLTRGLVDSWRAVDDRGPQRRRSVRSQHAICVAGDEIDGPGRGRTVRRIE